MKTRYKAIPKEDKTWMRDQRMKEEWRCDKMTKEKKIPRASELKILISEMTLGCAMFAKDIPWKKKEKMIRELNKGKEGKLIVRNFLKRLEEVEKMSDKEIYNILS